MKSSLTIRLTAAAIISISGLAAGQTKVSPAALSGQAKASPAASPQKTLSTAETDAIIDKAGSTPPDWWSQVPLNYPKTLDLTWDQVAKGWQPQRNLGAYVWGVIQPNPAKWKEGIRLMHHVLTVVKDNPQKVKQTAETLGNMYSRFVQDHARAAFWYRKSGNQTCLARCYFRLGDSKRAKDLLAKATPDDDEAIRIYIEMGDYAEAIRRGEQMGQFAPQLGYLLAGDAARLSGKYSAATAYYQKVSKVTATGDKHMAKYVEQAQTNLQTLKVFENYDAAKLKDGTYTASAQGYRGTVDVQVVVAGKKIMSVTVVKHKEDGYFYYICHDRTTSAIVNSQGVRGVDAIAGATITSGAIINAAAKALAGAMP